MQCLTRSLCGAVVAIAAGSVFAVEADRQNAPQIDVKAQFIELDTTTARRIAAASKNEDSSPLEAALAKDVVSTTLSAEQRDRLLAALNKERGVDLLSAPKIVTRARQPAMIEIMRKFPHATKWEREAGGTHWKATATETRNCGVTLRVEPDVDDTGRIMLKVAPEVVEFLGFRDLDSGRSYPAMARAAQPFAQIPAAEANPRRRLRAVFSTRKTEAGGILEPGEALLLANLPETENTKPFISPAKSRRLLVLVSAEAHRIEQR